MERATVRMGNVRDLREKKGLAPAVPSAPGDAAAQPGAQEQLRKDGIKPPAKAKRLVAVLAVLAVAAIAAGVVIYRAQQSRAALPAGFFSTNGRLEATEINVSSKLAGRVLTVLVEEGDTVDAGQVIARMDDAEIQAQLRTAQANVRRTREAKLQADALTVQRTSEFGFARDQLDRTSRLQANGYATQQLLDQRRTELDTATAARNAALAGQNDALAATEAAEAEVARINTLIDDSVLKAPKHARVEYKLVQSGEVVAAGAAVVTLLDITDVYMTVFVPASAAGHLHLGDEARLILDPIPQYVVPAIVTFVASHAQFTPKTVETAEEREKLLFRVKLTIAEPLLQKYEQAVKTGVRGMGYVRTAPDAAWPAMLAVKLP